MDICGQTGVLQVYIILRVMAAIMHLEVAYIVRSDANAKRSVVAWCLFANWSRLVDCSCCYQRHLYSIWIDG